MCCQTVSLHLVIGTTTMSSTEKTTSWDVEYQGVNFTDVEGGPSTWASAVGSTVMLAFFVEGVVGTCWILIALSRVAELRRSVVNVFVIHHDSLR